MSYPVNTHISSTTSPVLTARQRISLLIYGTPNPTQAQIDEANRRAAERLFANENEVTSKRRFVRSLATRMRMAEFLHGETSAQYREAVAKHRQLVAELATAKREARQC